MKEKKKPETRFRQSGGNDEEVLSRSFFLTRMWVREEPPTHPMISSYSSLFSLTPSIMQFLNSHRQNNNKPWKASRSRRVFLCFVLEKPPLLLCFSNNNEIDTKTLLIRTVERLFRLCFRLVKQFMMDFLCFFINIPFAAWWFMRWDSLGSFVNENTDSTWKRSPGYSFLHEKEINAKLFSMTREEIAQASPVNCSMIIYVTSESIIFEAFEWWENR